MSWLQHRTKPLFGGSPQASVRLAQTVGTSDFLSGPSQPPTSQYFTIMYAPIAEFIILDMKLCSFNKPLN